MTFNIVGSISLAIPSSIMAGGVDPYFQNTRYVRTIGTKEYTLSGPNLQFSTIGDPTNWTGEDTVPEDPLE